MRLIRVGTSGAEQPAVLLEPGLALNVADLIDDFDGAFWDNGGPAELERLINELPSSLATMDVESVRLGTPIARPPKIVCIGLNYADHARESSQPAPPEPVVFLKAPNTVVGPNDDVVLPRNSTKTDWEVELGVVIGREASYLESEAAARAVIGGFVLSSDLSEREFQLERGGQWDKGKCCATFNPLGPWLVTPDEFANSDPARLWCDVNGDRMQYGTTADMIFGVERLVCYLSQFMVLEPGDLVNTGTPAGVGLGRKPERYLKNGDVLRLGADGLGEQQHSCRGADVVRERQIPERRVQR